MTLFNAGESKTDPVSGIAGLIYSVWTGDADLSPTFPAGTLTSGSTKRKNLGTFIDAIARVFGSIFSVGTGAIAHGANSVSISDSAVKTSSLIIPVIVGVPDSACFALGAICSVNGTVVITGNANVAAALGLSVGYLAVNV